MYAKSLILLAVAGVAVGGDINLGSTEHGVKIFDGNKEASPAIWRRVEDVTISANETDVISGIVIKDARPDKDGEARIVHGGVGQQNVLIELKSPTILRGLDFHIEVYAVPKNEYVPDNNTTDTPADEVTTSTESTTKIDEEKESNATTDGSNTSTTVIPDGAKVNVPVNIGSEDMEKSRQNRELTVAPQDTSEASTAPASVTEEQEYSSTITSKISAHEAQISGFRPKFVEFPSHPVVIATDEPSIETNVKSVHKREVVSDSSEEDESEEEYPSEDDEDESNEAIAPKIQLYTADKLATPIPYIL